MHEAEQLIARGRPLPAYDLTKRLLATHPANARLLLLNARALRRCGALWRALTILEGMSSPDVDGERRGLLAAVHKEIFLRGQAAGTDPKAHLRIAQRLYWDVFDESTGQAYWHGINAATLAFVLGYESVARALAERVLGVCQRPAGSATDYWLPATRGEAALLLGLTTLPMRRRRSLTGSGGNQLLHEALLLVQQLLREREVRLDDLLRRRQPWHGGLGRHRRSRHRGRERRMT